MLHDILLEWGKSRCLAVCADNASAMVRALRLLPEDPDLNDLPISYYGCIDHSLNLLATDILKQINFKRDKNNIIAISKTISCSQVLREQLKVIQMEIY